ncbi:hypothetical protein CDO52_17400 [Nocardiopsis gilva YIM 90087]|uniref:NRDE family protein n=1 Tax=Nocardiopsis gilva YIM 90087 TaxID=1235441 RepID=A0A223S8A9_9ACTN|nr:NRDE family protein [Nocardiopsis gilva]ASU84338.1 hypothetical protein CDO52_17400 [Nocardiopsis gilva YIM 90087]
MCTAIVGFDPEAEVPLLLVAIRDEMVERGWEGPDRHWPRYPDLLGGRDPREGGTWLAVRTSEGHGKGPRVGALLNGWPRGDRTPNLEPTVPADVDRLSRGRLPLLMAEYGTLGLGTEDLHRYEPFHLLGADAESAVLYSWDGRELAEQTLPPGVSVLVNTGLDRDEPRAKRHTPLFEEARPRPGAGVLRTAREPDEIWGAWRRLVDEAARGPARTGGLGPDPDDPSSLIARADLGHGRVWASGSVSLVACSEQEARYAFTGAPGDPSAWRVLR